MPSLGCICHSNWHLKDGDVFAPLRAEIPKFSSFLGLRRPLFKLFHLLLPGLFPLSFELCLFLAHEAFLDGHGEHVLKHRVQGVFVFFHDGLSGLLYGYVNGKVERFLRVHDAQFLDVLDAEGNDLINRVQEYTEVFV